jgi:hypothetical protein
MCPTRCSDFRKGRRNQKITSAKKSPGDWPGRFFCNQPWRTTYLLFFAAFLAAGFAADLVVFFETGFLGDAIGTSFHG